MKMSLFWLETIDIDLFGMSYEEGILHEVNYAPATTLGEFSLRIKML